MIIYYIDTNFNVKYNVKYNVKTWKFPGGEIGVSIPTEHLTTKVRQIILTATLRNSDEIMELMLAVDAMKRCHILSEIVLVIPYLAYARQDRVCNPGESLSIKVLANMINSLELDKVTLYDPHSDVSPALFNNVTVVDQCEILRGYNFAQFDAIIAPDAGAQKKAYAVAKRYGVKKVITANKTRDPMTGKILNTELNGSVDGLSVLVVDDICDGGATFIHLANELVHARIKKLYVTHGIFSKGVDAVTPFYDMILTTNSYNPELVSSDKVTLIRNFY
jgi:ribose-phosphate pyrophosphokinase